MRAILGLVLIAGCGSEDGGYDMRLVDRFGTASTEQVAALSMLMDHYQAGRDWPLPAVEWIRGEALTCDGVDALGVQRRGYQLAGEGCVFGATRRHLGFVQLADDGKPWSSQSMAHELCHWVHDDQGHVGPCQEDGPGIKGGRELLTSAGL